jgi:hypothetical protein
MEATQNTTNINGKKDILLREKLIIYEAVFCGLAIKSLHILTEMPIAQNSIRYQVAIDRNCYRRALKVRDSGILYEKRAMSQEKREKRNPNLLTVSQYVG